MGGVTSAAQLPALVPVRPACLVVRQEGDATILGDLLSDCAGWIRWRRGQQTEGHCLHQECPSRLRKRDMGLPEVLVAQHVRRYLDPLYRPQPLPGLDSTAAVHPPGTPAPGTHWRTASMWDDVLASLATVLVSSGSSVPARPRRTLTRLWFACATASYAAMPKLRCMFQLPMPPICTPKRWWLSTCHETPAWKGSLRSGGADTRCHARGLNFFRHTC